MTPARPGEQGKRGAPKHHSSSNSSRMAMPMACTARANQMQTERHGRGGGRAHRCLLHQQLEGLRDGLRDDVLARAAVAAKGLLSPVRERVGRAGVLRDQPALLADGGAVRVALLEESLPHEAGGAVADEAVALHLAETEPAVPASALDRLSCGDLDLHPRHTRRVGGMVADSPARASGRGACLQPCA